MVRLLTGGRRAAVVAGLVLAGLVLAGLGVAAAVAAQKPGPPPPEAVEALMHCAPWRPEYTPDPAIPPPTELRAEVETRRVRLTWRDNAEDETCYGVLRVLPPRPGVENEWALLVVTLPNATETSLPASMAGRACYYVYAGNAAGRSGLSNLVCADVPVELVPGARPTPSPAPRRAADALLAPNRETLAICVDGVDEASAAVPGARARVEQALALIAQHPHFVQAGLAAVPPVVDDGCPLGPYLLEPNVSWENGAPIRGAGRRVEEAGIYRLFVFLLPPQELARVIRGDLDNRRTAEEMLCAGHQCWEVTTGLYLTPEEATDGPFLATRLTKGLGLEPTLPPGNAPVPPGRRP